MVVRKRARGVLIPLVLYSISAAVVGYFVHHAHSGARGLEAKQQFKIRVYEINRELDTLKAERSSWERRVALLRSDQIDRDLLEERARVVLGRVHRNDLVVITGRD
jgi:cell division protein FtsB